MSRERRRAASRAHSPGSRERLLEHISTAAVAPGMHVLGKVSQNVMQNIFCCVSTQHTVVHNLAVQEQRHPQAQERRRGVPDTHTARPGRQPACEVLGKAKPRGGNWEPSRAILGAPTTANGGFCIPYGKHESDLAADSC
mmetsp:Transcript_3916/g.7164  ORF Transcript_3916/g.7164 Transcript_3916/m.7164 type:complete len:140 (-) Transcript_3916:280-699(-)